MKTSLRLATSLIFASGVLVGSGEIARSGETRAVGVVATIIDVSGNVSSISASIAIGKTSAAGTASIVGNETATSAVAGGGALTVTGNNTAAVGYQLDAESTTSLGTVPTSTTGNPAPIRVNSNDSNPKIVTIIP